MKVIGNIIKSSFIIEILNRVHRYLQRFRHFLQYTRKCLWSTRLKLSEIIGSKVFCSCSIYTNLYNTESLLWQHLLRKLRLLKNWSCWLISVLIIRLEWFCWWIRRKSLGMYAARHLSDFRYFLVNRR